ncbi:hypothetical protein GQS78_01320 [Thermococcus bergensis]|uniref:hypothetical protein n=1 Tax=Thermococcus bergensis TaxID=2689387 RepID=UPI001CECA6FF|nr:hypothetical protein [Thermococcus bergensis]MCA6212962.1 hypothetical protein [Thermococcus bergensis]
MKKFFGLFLAFLGLLILLKSIRPEVYDYLLPYAPYIKRAFWGVVLIVAGLYVLVKNKTVRTSLALAFVLYLALFLVTPGAYYSWRFSSRDAGEITTLGKFNSSEILIENIAAEITVEQGTDGIEVLSNLPVKIEEGETLVISCLDCEDYKNGRLLIRVGDNAVKSLALRNTIGDINIDLGTSLLTFDNVVGDITISGTFSSLVARNFIGDMEVELERCPEDEEYCSQIEIYRGSGEINISLPAGTKVVPMIEGSLTSLTINKGFETGEKTLKLIVKNFIGKIVVE